jgi:hypothetical protein
MEKVEKILANAGLTTNGIINIGCDDAVRKVIIAHIPEAKPHFRGRPNIIRFHT